ncbi:MAG: PKD domain-containing protein [bacterium]
MRLSSIGLFLSLAVLILIMTGCTGTQDFDPNVYGVYATSSRISGPVPMSVGFKATVTGGVSPYQIVWDFGDNENTKAGVSVAHVYVEPGIYTVTCMVADFNGNMVGDWLTVTAYNTLSGPTK